MSDRLRMWMGLTVMVSSLGMTVWFIFWKDEYGLAALMAFNTAVLVEWVYKRLRPAKPKCRYCLAWDATCKVVWRAGAFNRAGPVAVPYCGKCSLKDALAKRGMTAPVKEGYDYDLDFGDAR